MNKDCFYSDNIYLSLPSLKSEKVALAIDSSALVYKSIKLYQPFSKKAIYFKRLLKFLLTNFNFIFKKVLPTQVHIKGDFIIYLEEKLDVDLVSSVYYSTANDKVVLQLLSNNKIIGYLKFPLNEVGIMRVKNEKKAIETFSNLGIVDVYRFADYYNEIPYILINEVEGTVENVAHDKLIVLLDKFKKIETFRLNAHPRILQLFIGLKNNNLYEESNILESICNKSTIYYHEVFEHGDFAPWNLISNQIDVIPFDFEYYEEFGLEYFDIIKYYYQIATLLENIPVDKILNFINSKIEIDEIKMLFQVFLIKEILQRKENQSSTSFEKHALLVLSNGQK